ncbi:lipoprotein NlpI [Aliidiomarina halalkaliphila]
MIRTLSFGGIALFLLSACTVTPDAPTEPEVVESAHDYHGSEPQLFLVEPLAADQNLEIELLQLTELLYKADLDDEQRAQLLHHRAMTFDYLGLPTLALVDINQALELKPAMAEAYHSLGIYYSQAGEYQAAFEAFDSVIELQSDHEYVYLNRGLAAYYNGQFELALSDFADYYFQNPADPFRVIWYYFAAWEINPGRAFEQLNEQWEAANADPWGQKILEFLVGEIDSDTLIMYAFENAEDRRMLTYQLCEAYFYMGKVAAMNGQHYQAMNYFKLTLATNVYPYLEHRYARTELNNIRDLLRSP